MAVISTLVTVPGGVTSSNDIVVPGGILQVANGGAIVGTIDAQSGRAIIAAGATATGTTVQDNLVISGFNFFASGGQFVEGGVASSTLVASGGFEVVVSGGVTSGALVLNGGVELVGNDGPGTNLAVGMTLYGGGALIGLGGAASGTTVTNGGELFVAGGADSHASVVSGGTIYVTTDVLSSGTTGTDNGTSVGSGGTMNVSSGGMASGTSVGSSGTLNVSSGGVVSALTINDPNDPGVTAIANVLSGGKVDGSTKIDGGQLILDAGAVFEQPHAKLTIINTGELVLEQNTFRSTIHDFGGQDFMDLTKIRFIGQGPDATTATFFQTNGVLQVAQGSHFADLHLAGTYTTANFAPQSDGAHGTTVTFVP